MQAFLLLSNTHTWHGIRCTTSRYGVSTLVMRPKNAGNVRFFYFCAAVSLTRRPPLSTARVANVVGGGRGWGAACFARVHICALKEGE